MASDAPIVFRRARAADSALLLEIVRASLGAYGLKLDVVGADRELVDVERHFPPADEHAPQQMWVVEEAGEIAGLGGFTRHDATTCEVKKMYLRPECKGRGIGRRLLAHLEARARAAGYRRAWLETNSLLVEAQALYRLFGYAPTDDGQCCARCDLKFAKDL